VPKLFNTIIVFDVYAWAENEEDAREAAIANIRDTEQPLEPSEQTALDTGRTGPRTAWINRGPLVGAAVAEADYQAVKGKTCLEVWESLNKKPEKK